MKQLLPCLLAVVLVGCSPDEPLITSFDDSWRYLATVPSGVASIRMPSGTVDNPSVWSPAEATVPYPIHTIDEFRDHIYLLSTSEQIIILDRQTLQAVDTISTAGSGSPAAIAFANATTAYVALPSLASVGIVDLTVGSVVGLIPVQGAPVDIAAVGNQLCAVLQNADEAVIIDSRTNAVEARIALPSANPAYVVGIPGNEMFAVVTLGAGKVADDDREPTTPTLTYISILDRAIDNSVPLTNRESDGPFQYPFALTANSQGFTYVPVQQGLLFANSRNAARASLILFEEYHYCTFHPARAEIVTVRPDGRTIEVYDEFLESQKLTVTVPDSVGTLLGIAR